MNDFFLEHAISNPDPEKQFAAAAFILFTRILNGAYVFAQVFASDPRIREEIRAVSQLSIDALCELKIEQFREAGDYFSLHTMIFGSHPASPGMPSDKFDQISLPIQIQQKAAIAAIGVLQTSPKFLITEPPTKSEFRQSCLENGFAEDSEPAKALATKKLAEKWETEMLVRKNELAFIQDLFGSAANNMVATLAKTTIVTLDTPSTRPVPQVEQKELKTESVVGLPRLVALDKATDNLIQLLPPQMYDFLDRIRNEQILSSRLKDWLDGKGPNPLPPLPENQKRDMMGTLSQISAMLLKPVGRPAAQKAVNR